MKPAVAHLTIEYLPITENWLYVNQIVHLKRYKPIIITQKTINLDKFPIQDIYTASNRGFFVKKINTLYTKLTGYYLSGHFKNILEKNNVKLLHAHYGNEGVRYLKLKRDIHLPMITTFYGCDVTLIPEIPYWKERYTQLFRECDLFLTEGGNMRNELIRLGCPEDKIIIQHLGVDLENLKFTQRTIPENGNITILIAGRLEEKKGIPYAIKAFAKVKEKHPNIQMKILGDGSMKNQIESLIKELNLSDSIRLLGQQSHDVFKREISEAHIFMLPSIRAKDGDTEGGAPVALIEAQATGLPVISSYHADIPEVVVEGKSALLAPEKDVEGLTKHLGYLVEHPGLWREMGMIGRKHIEQNYNVLAQVFRLEKIYDELCENIG